MMSWRRNRYLRGDGGDALRHDLRKSLDIGAADLPYQDWSRRHTHLREIAELFGVRGRRLIVGAHGDPPAAASL